VIEEYGESQPCILALMNRADGSIHSNLQNINCFPSAFIKKVIAGYKINEQQAWS
jgi:hypothetical protein